MGWWSRKKKESPIEKMIGEIKTMTPAIHSVYCYVGEDSNTKAMNVIMTIKYEDKDLAWIGMSDVQTEELINNLHLMIDEIKLRRSRGEKG